MADVKTAAKPSSQAGKPKNANNFMLNLIIVVACIAIGQIVYHVVFGSASNFLDAEKHKPKNFMGNMYLGGMIVPFLIATFLTMLSFVVERFMTIFKANGKMNAGEFVRKVQYHLANKNVDAALAECDKQAGSVGNVMRAGLVKYREMTTNHELDTEQKVISIQKEIEEATALELPMLEKNLVFLSTIASVATLLGLLGTVLGMIKSFQAMGTSGAPDASALAAGISEALYNTALGIGTSFFAIIGYNFFTTIIDGITFGIDESGFTLTQSFAANYK
ncbi:MAG TPA: MotA/TolQ/ExbB proton channel family protein [Bacteroidia bacterium]|jgi:biopolymer transport protein ExbB|nr:MotA/TolQ/ExbB proton channel family protein [Chitinophagales bacterium]HLO70986.1 MotA/TolQ/ExbB proton channel family protein [Flavipsychrobacter sp.]HLP33190.1 MotA/TolQ/ExbB proton channel family protein [Bacteroidia bacterium]